MLVHQLAQNLNITAETVRYYTRIGMLRPRRNPENGYREYGPDDQNRLRFCVRARQLGFSLDQIQAFLRQADSGDAPCPEVKKTMCDNLRKMETMLREIQTLYARMQAAITSWDTMPDCREQDHSVCHLIECWNRDIDEGVAR